MPRYLCEGIGHVSVTASMFMVHVFTSCCCSSRCLLPILGHLNPGILRVAPASGASSGTPLSDACMHLCDPSHAVLICYGL